MEIVEFDVEDKAIFRTYGKTISEKLAAEEAEHSGGQMTLFISKTPDLDQ